MLATFLLLLVKMKDTEIKITVMSFFSGCPDLQVGKNTVGGKLDLGFRGCRDSLLSSSGFCSILETCFVYRDSVSNGCFRGDFMSWIYLFMTWLFYELRRDD